MNVDNEIQKLMDKLREEHKVLPYVYLNDDTFVPGKDTVLYSGPYFSDEEVIVSIKSLLLGRWPVAGNDVHLFESKFAKAIGDKYGLMVNSGSSANLLMIAAIKSFYKWADGSEIIISSIGFPTTLSVLPQNNLVPIFIDIKFDTLNFDLNLIEEKITNKTKAIFLSPVLGNSPDIDKLTELCGTYDLKLILDGCDSLGSKWRNQHLNKYAIATSESLYAAHIISTLQGGMITSNNEEIIKIARSMATWGRACTCSSTGNLLPNGECGKRFSNWLSPRYEGMVDHRYIFDKAQAYNLLPLEMQGSIGLVQLTKLNEIINRRKYSYKIISELFTKYINGVRLPSVLEYSDPLWFGTGIICESGELKHKLVTFLEKNKIQTRNLFAGNLLAQSGYMHLGNYKEYPCANEILDRVFFIGCAPAYGKNIFNYIESVLSKFKNE